MNLQTNGYRWIVHLQQDRGGLEKRDFVRKGHAEHQERRRAVNLSDIVSRLLLQHGIHLREERFSEEGLISTIMDDYSMHSGVGNTFEDGR